MNKEIFKKAAELDAVITKLENIKEEFVMTKEINFAWEGLNSKYQHEFIPVPKEFNKLIYDLLMNELEKAKQEFKEL